jgi:hypothetical protein
MKDNVEEWKVCFVWVCLFAITVGVIANSSSSTQEEKQIWLPEDYKLVNQVSPETVVDILNVRFSGSTILTTSVDEYKEKISRGDIIISRHDYGYVETSYYSKQGNEIYVAQERHGTSSWYRAINKAELVDGKLIITTEPNWGIIIIHGFVFAVAEAILSLIIALLLDSFWEENISFRLRRVFPGI